MAHIFSELLHNQSFLSAFFSTLLMIALGVLLRRIGVLRGESRDVLQALIIKVSIPCWAFDTFMSDFDAVTFVGNLKVMLLMLGIYVLILLISQVVFARLGSERARFYGVFFAIGQVTLFAMPVVCGIYAADPTESLLCFNMMSVVFRFMIYGYAFFVISGLKFTKTTAADTLKKIFFTPIIIAMLCGLTIWCTQNIMPQVGGNPILRLDLTVPVLYSAVPKLAVLATPLAMINIGVSLAESKFGEVLHDKFVWIVSALRMFAAPAIALAAVCLLQWTGWMDMSEQVAMSIVMGFGAPLTAVIPVYCVRFNREVAFASRVCLLSTLMCVVSIPLCYMMVQWALTLPIFA